jgi:hypothetical protein
VAVMGSLCTTAENPCGDWVWNTTSARLTRICILQFWPIVAVKTQPLTAI